jgi:ketosteroid isomerase-like protein
VPLLILDPYNNSDHQRLRARAILRGVGAAADIVRGQFEAVNRGDFAAAMDAYADDVELIALPNELLSGVYRGKERVGEWFGDWFRTFSAINFEWLDVVESGSALALRARFIATGRKSGVELADEYFYAYEVRDGKVVRVRFCPSWEDALQAAGLAGVARS